MTPAHDARFTSAGSLPDGTAIDEALHDALQTYSSVTDGQVSTVYPALESVDPNLFGLALVSVNGGRYTAGDADTPFSIMSVAKPFVFALVCEQVGIDRARDLIGVDATGLPFDSVFAVERGDSARTNPMVNAGAIATTSLVPGADIHQRWDRLAAGLSAFAGRTMTLDEDMLTSAREANTRNRALALLLAGAGAIAGDPAEATELYTRQSCLSVTAIDLAVMGATLADGGVNPVTGERVVGPDVARGALAVMTIAGLYQTSGSWLFDVGLPAKSGIGGGIVTVSPGKGAFGTYSPPLDGEGNSVRGRLAAEAMSRWLGLDILASEPL